MKFLGRGSVLFAISFAGIFLAGCGTQATYKFDPLTQDQPPAATPTNSVSGAPAKTPPSADTNTSGNQATSSIPENSPTKLLMGDIINVTFSDLPTPITPIEDTIKEDGSIVLPYDQKFYAVGKTIGELQNEIRARYVPQYFKNLTVSISIQFRYYYVGGEVRSPNRQTYTGPTTVLRAIDTAGGFTDWAWRANVKITRANGKRVVENCKAAIKNPSLDLPIYPGDRIEVPHVWW